MPYLKPAETDTVTLPSDPAYTVVLKRRATFGDQRAAQAAMVSIDVNKPSEAKADVSPFISTLLQRLIVSWNVDGEDGQLLPINAATIDLLDPIDGQFLAAEAAKRSALRTPERERDFATPSS